MNARLEQLLTDLDAKLHGDAATTVTDVVSDSRQVKPGALFVALRGERTDGHHHLKGAVDAGAAAVLVEEAPLPLPVPHAQVPDTRRALPVVASRFWGHPGDHLTLVGVTGTNGKTSTVRMIESILDADGRRVGSLGTISVRFGGEEIPTVLTTPEADAIQRTLARMLDGGAESVVMEVSSHALAQGRVGALRYDVAAFTNLSQDHLDFHGDMESYARAKHTLFEPTHLDGPAIVHVGDPAGEDLARRLRAEGRTLLTYGRGSSTDADVRSVEEEIGLDHSRIVVEDRGSPTELRVPLPGDFQVTNAVGAFTVARALGVGIDSIRQGLAACPAVPGRLERVSGGRPVVLVDYAHTPDALDRVLDRIRPLVPGRLITVFGCGGDRDRAKRIPMAEAACRHSDHVLATSDNPRTEDPERILEDIAAGLSGSHERIVDRREAIRRAVEMAAADDVVLIAGKGHETVQIVGDRRLPFDDRAEARAALAARENAE
jgi:UDP-N-acetylmuramoyl-L-alanyl-D-glutamate--2,6-diaminopimelate ligase